MTEAHLKGASVAKMSNPTTTGLVILAFVLAVYLIIIIVRMVYTIQPYQSGVVTVLGSYRRTLGAGQHFVTPIAKVYRVDLREQSGSLAPFPAPASDGAQLVVGGRIEYRIVDAPKSVFQTRDLPEAVRSALKDSILSAVAEVDSGVVSSKGWSLADTARGRASDRLAACGVTASRITLSIQSPAGLIEYPSRGAPTAEVRSSMPLRGAS